MGNVHASHTPLSGSWLEVVCARQNFKDTPTNFTGDPRSFRVKGHSPRSLGHVCAEFHITTLYHPITCCFNGVSAAPNPSSLGWPKLGSLKVANDLSWLRSPHPSSYTIVKGTEIFFSSCRIQNTSKVKVHTNLSYSCHQLNHKPDFHAKISCPICLLHDLHRIVDHKLSSFWVGLPVQNTRGMGFFPRFFRKKIDGEIVVKHKMTFLWSFGKYDQSFHHSFSKITALVYFKEKVPEPSGLNQN